MALLVGERLSDLLILLLRLFMAQDHGDPNEQQVTGYTVQGARATIEHLDRTNMELYL